MERFMDELLYAVSKSEVSSIHLVDAENLIGTGFITTDQVAKLRSAYELVVPTSQDDLVVVAVGPQNRRAVYEGWPGAIFEFRKGKDGADYRLAYTLAHIRNLKALNHLYLASGDGGLYPTVQKAKDAGLDVTCVTGIGKQAQIFKNEKTVQVKMEVKK